MRTCLNRVESQPQTPQLLQVPAAIIGNTSPLAQGYWPTARPVACQLHLQLGTAGGNSPQTAPATPPSPASQFRVEAKQFCGRSLRQKQSSLCVTIANRRRQGIVCPSLSQAYDSSRLMAIRSGSDRSFGKILLKPSSSSSSSSAHPDRC